MNILILCAGTSWGGIETQTVVLANSLRKTGNKIIVACTRKGFVHIRLDKLGFSHCELCIPNSGDITAVPKIMRIISREKIHVVI